MGQGQADLAIQTLRECAREGEWLCLKNLHLVISWLPVLEKASLAKTFPQLILQKVFAFHFHIHFHTLMQHHLK